MTRPGSPAGHVSSDATVVAELERVELAARERRLTAAAEADRILAEAATAVAAIDAGVDARIESSLRDLRAAYLARADAEVAGIEAALDEPAAGDRTDDGGEARSDAGTAGFEAAVERLVRAVLGEPVG